VKVAAPSGATSAKVAHPATDGGRLTWNSSRPRPSTSTASTTIRASRDTTWPEKNAHGGRGAGDAPERIRYLPVGIGAGEVPSCPP
jgi:hypothetical protein